MTERGIIMSGPLIAPTMDGRKSKTRRVVPDLPDWVIKTTERVENVGPWFHFIANHPEGKCGHKKCGCIGSERGEQPSMWTVRCPYGEPGDQLWVREMWNCGTMPRQGRRVNVCFPKVGKKDVRLKNDTEIEQWERYKNKRWVPSIHMPRWASRIQLEIISVRVERLQDLTEEDAIAEGMPALPNSEWYPTWVKTFLHYWNGLNADRGFEWDANPWVWVIEFRRIA